MELDPTQSLKSPAGPIDISVDRPDTDLLPGVGSVAGGFPSFDAHHRGWGMFQDWGGGGDWNSQGIWGKYAPDGTPVLDQVSYRDLLDVGPTGNSGPER